MTNDECETVKNMIREAEKLQRERPRYVIKCLLSTGQSDTLQKMLNVLDGMDRE